MSVSRQDMSVAVVITTYNHAHFLAEAIGSALNQTRRPDQVIVVDDGSTDDPESVTRTFPEVLYIRQDNAGLSSARNTGLRQASTRFITFLDADDRLMPRAVEAGLSAIAISPGVAFVYGAHRKIDRNGNILGEDVYRPVGSDAYASFLYQNPVGMHATVLYDRQKLLDIGGYDTRFRRCEDYDVYLRLSRLFPVYSYPELVAEYRWHDANMSHQRGDMLKWSLEALNGQSQFALQKPQHQKALTDGRAVWTKYYSDPVTAATPPTATQDRSPRSLARRYLRPVARTVYRLLPQAVRAPLLTRLGIHRTPPVGKVNFGDLSTTNPLSRDFGYNRGTPVDRGYIEDFLEHNKSLVQGRVLEIGDDSYSRRFGGDRIEQQDILHVHAGNHIATIVGDMSEPGVLPDAAFDCLVLTQTLHLIYDMPNAVDRIYAALKPGGVALITVPGITPIDHGEWKSTWYWSLTRYSLARLLETRFGTGNVRITTYGNVYSATGFIQGAALEELDPGKLEKKDEAYTIVVAAVARRAAE